MSTKTYSARLTRNLLLMHMYQGKGRWGFTCRSASFDLANLYYEYQREVRTYTSPSNSFQPILHYGAPLDFPTRRHAIALTLILASFISIQFKFSMIK